MSNAEKAATAVKKAGARKALNAANLTRLGPERLAALLMEISESGPAIKRRIKLELAAEAGAGVLAAEIARRIDAIDDSRARINWRKYKEFVRDLDAHRQAVAGPLALLDANLALDLIVRLVGLSASLASRIKDTKGELEEVFSEAVTDAAEIAPRAALVDASSLADRLFEIVRYAPPGLSLPLLRATAPALHGQPLVDLRNRLETVSKGRGAPRAWRVGAQILADAQGDVDGFIALFTTSEAVLPPVGAEIARRLLGAGRMEEARKALERSEPDRASAGDPGAMDWTQVQIEVMEALGDAEGAQAARWTSFERDLNPNALRAYLRRLDGFDDVEAEDKAMDLALEHRDVHGALALLVDWPRLDLAARLVAERGDQLAGDKSELLERAARALEGRYPLAATLLLRALIWDVARHADTERYTQAKRWMLEAASLAAALPEDGGYEDHEAFAERVARLRRW
ncbi:DUF6880 family protein [Caulobacter sp. NIBR2454]|uniref:DUF6880 family protein n=1 Tax=Caulobacter sp. NIBR2454 TaxID=3015996 RepID=UPI0022B6F4DB|nr:DUF6880 family protein [Caulobacter sp. NIBR2454]